MKKLIFTLVLGLAALGAQAAVTHLMPKVHQCVENSNGTFALGRAVAVTDPTECSWLTTTLTEMGLTVDENAEAKIVVEKVDEITGAFNHNVAEYPDEAYSIEVAADQVTIKVLTQTGTIRAAQTLRQLAMDVDALEAVTITDWPAFKVRGFMHDTGRSFLSVDELKQEIDLLSRFKVNTFHWHLTDITGWRLEIKAYPDLTGSKGITRYPGCYYTQDQAKEIQDYAYERGMIVIPEIDMPGHSDPFKNVMGHAMTTDDGIAELKVILKEVAELFDKAPYIHIGGDEVNFDDTFLINMISYIHDDLNKKVVIWNQYNYSPAKKVDPTTIKCDMTTNWATSGKLSEGVPNIDMRYNYTNHFDVFADLVGIYKSNIFYVDKGNDNVGGTISAAWSDTKVKTADDIVRQNNIYANILASGERAWFGGGEQYIETGGVTLPNSGTEFDEFADWERRFLYHKNTTLAAAKAKIPYVKQTNVVWHVTDQIPNGGSNTASFYPEDHMNDATMPTSFEVNGTNYGVNTVTGAGIYLRHIWHGTVKGFYENPQNNMTAYAWTNVYSPTEQDAAAFIEFYTYSRSGNEKAPSTGCWDRRGSKIWLNGTEIAAPTWEQPDATIKQNQTESGLANENFTARDPIAIHLNQGWNRVFMKLPHVSNGGTGRDKWQFTFVITDAQGNDALEGLTYSPMKCLNAADDALAAKILEARNAVNSKIGTKVGYYAANAESTALLAKADELMADLDNVRTETERAAQVAELEALITAFNASTLTLVQPTDGAYYYLNSMRDTRYATASSSALVGNTTTSEASAWKFVPRSDNTYDIVNYSTKEYISPTASNNTQLKLTSTQPTAGWTIKAAATLGYVIITSGTAEFNQTKSSQSYQVYNWGGGSNTSDEGCQYMFTLTDYTDSTEPTVVTIPEATVTLVDIKLDGTSGPYKVPDDQAAPVLSATATTAVIHVTPTATPDVAAYAAATNTDVAAKWFSFAVLGGTRCGPRYMGNQGTEGWYTQNATLGTNEVKVAIVCDPEVGYTMYLNGSAIRTMAASGLGEYGFVHFGNVSSGNALYVGGIVTSEDKNKYPLTGTVHSARFWDSALTAEQIAALDYDNLKSSASTTIEALETFPPQGQAYDLLGRKVSNPSNGLYIIGGKKVMIHRN